MVTTVSPVKTVKQIEMSFGMGIHGRHGDPDLPPEEAFFSARDAMLTRYMMSLRVLPSVRLLCHKPILYRNDWTNRAVFFGMGLPSTYPILCCKEIWVSSKPWVLPSGTLSQTPDFNFATASRSRCQQISSSTLSTVEFVDDTYTTVMAVYYKSINSNS